MQLTVRDVAHLLNVSEKTIYRWLSQGHLPAYKVNEQYRFNRAELLEWATSQKINVSVEIFNEPESSVPAAVSLAEAIESGGIHYRVGGTDKASVLACVVELLHLPDEVDRKFLLNVLLTRESLGSTGVGDGIAIPHVRNPIVLHIPRPMVAIGFLETPIDFAALDGKPVHTLFTLISPTIRAHLGLLSKLAFALRDERFRDAVANRGTRQELLEAVAGAERQMVTVASSPARDDSLSTAGMRGT